MALGELLEQAAGCADSPEALNDTLSGIPALLDPFRKDVPPSGASDPEVISMLVRCASACTILLLKAHCLKRAMQLLITSGFDLPIDADKQVRRQHFSEPVRMTADDIASLYPDHGAEFKMSDIELESGLVAVIISLLQHASAPWHTVRDLSPDMLRDACRSNYAIQCRQSDQSMNGVSNPFRELFFLNQTELQPPCLQIADCRKKREKEREGIHSKVLKNPCCVRIIPDPALSLRALLMALVRQAYLEPLH